MKYWNDKTRTLLLFALAFLIYGFGIGRGFDFDDPLYISRNPLLSKPGAFYDFWFTSEAYNYYPLFWTLLRAQWLLWGTNPIGYHLVNLLMHSVNAVLVWRIAREWRLPGAWWVAALFAVHPINVQTLAWAAEQKNTWSFFFMALSLLAFIRSRREEDFGQYLLSLLSFAAALACKTSTVFLPVFLAICYGFRWEKRTLAVWLRLAPFYALGLAAGITTMWFEKHRVDAKSLLSTFSLWQRLEISGATFWFYLGKALFPVGLTPMYRGWVDTTATTHTALPGILLVAALLICALCWRRIGAPIALGFIYYALMLFPLLGVFDTNYFTLSLIADHWQYHALPGILVAVVAALQQVAQRWPRLAAYPNAVGAAAVIGLAALSSAHFALFENPSTLWTYVVKKNPEAWEAWYNLGHLFTDGHEPEKAIYAYRRSTALYPHYFASHYNLGTLLLEKGAVAEAEQEFFAAGKVNPDDPGVHNNHAVTLLVLHRDADAMAEFVRTLELDPSLVPPRVNLIALQLKHGQVQMAGKNLETLGTLSANDASLIAEAISTSAKAGSVPTADLRRFAQRAHEMNADQPELKSALVDLEAKPAAQ